MTQRKRGSLKPKRSVRNELPYYSTQYTPPEKVNANLPQFWGDDESTMFKIAILALIFCFSMYFFIMSCIGLNESKDGKQLDKDEWKAFFSFVLIVTFLMMALIVLIFFKIQ